MTTKLHKDFAKLLAEEGEEAIVKLAQNDPDYATHLWTTYEILVSPTGFLVKGDRPLSELLMEASEEGHKAAHKLVATIGQGAGKVKTAVTGAADVVTYNVVDRPIDGVKGFVVQRKLNRIANKNARRRRAEQRREARRAAKEAAASDANDHDPAVSVL